MEKEIIGLGLAIGIGLFSLGVQFGAWLAHRDRRRANKDGDGRDLVCLPDGGILVAPRRRFRL